MKEKNVSIVIVLLILLGAFAFVMFSPKAKDVSNIEGDTKSDISNVEENNMNQDTTQDNTQNTESLMVEIIKEGSGTPAVKGDTVTVSYIGTLENGTEFDKSANHGDGKFTFQVGIGQVIKGWDEGIVGMKVGEVRKLTVAPEYGYGPQAVGKIPANSTLIFEVEMFAIKK